MNTLKQQYSVCESRGFTLVEMLIALVVLSVGLLGLANLQATSLRMNDSAYFRSQAVSLGYDIFDRMRGNSVQALGGAYVTQPDGTATGGGLAATDVTDWQDLITTLLPGNAAGDGGIVACAAIPPITCRVTVQWDDTRAGGNNLQSIILESQL